MSLELSLNNHFLRLSSLPVDLKALKDKITTLYTSQLPKDYHLEYQTQDKHIPLTDDKDYQNLLETAKSSQENALKVHIVPKEVSDTKNKETENTNEYSQASLLPTESTKITETAVISNITNGDEPPVLIENKEEFESLLPAVTKTSSRGGRTKDNDAASNKSLPSSVDDHAEKQPIIDKVVEEVKEKGIVDLKNDIIHDPEFDPEPTPVKKLKSEGNGDLLEERKVSNGSLNKEQDNGNAQ